MVSVTFADLQSQFLTLPLGEGFIPFDNFQVAYEVLKQHTGAFANVTEKSVWSALDADALTFVVLRTILGMTPPEWAELAMSEKNSDASQGFARNLDTTVRSNRSYFRTARRSELVTERIKAMVSIAVEYINKGAPASTKGTVHRLDKFDTSHGLVSLQNVANNHVPYAVLLYERYLGRPFASHRDAVSEMIGDVMESAVEGQLAGRKITFRKTKRAERIPNFEQAPDFFVPTELAPSVIIEAKITSDDGTARDKVARIKTLANIRDERLREGTPSFQLIACIDGRGFRQRRKDMEQMLMATKGKLFTLNTLHRMVDCTDLAKFLPIMNK